ncbi:MAG TPA: aminotransferase class V-fold PLP-dependent enzyme [Caulobacteraceae bacterium]|jgi:selenocysteine lyase/cysteine desulfurase|nr:aminotransferase class V-fold PLP-dependent enzyme [Caulobacteraceae bacterium]
MISRRQSLGALAAAPFGALAWPAAALPADTPAAEPAWVAPSPRGNFKISGTYINAAYTHPLPLDAGAALREFVARRCDPGLPRKRGDDAKALFATLINAASPDAIAGTPSTSYGESFVIGALGLEGDRSAGIVTDILHFDGSLYAYGELAKLGSPLTILPMTPDGRIDMNRLADAVKPGTRLVSISLVSMVNGFEHDLKTVCDIAHKQGAYVYVDAIQGAGAVPIDVQASGVDFLSCSTFKWLMGDFGCGFLYVRPDLIPKLKRTEFGYHQPKDLAYHAFPGDKPGPVLFEAEPNDTTAAGRFEVGSTGEGAEAAAAVSLKNLLAWGVPNLQAARQPLMDRLYDKLSAHYQPMTPKGSRSSIIAFSLIGARDKLRSRITEARINIQLYPNRFRISPSVYNTPEDIDRLIGVLTA